MKKTKSTLMTAAILTAAAMGSHNVNAVGVAMAPVYGPPPAYTTTPDGDEYTEMTTTTTPVYGPPPAYTTTPDEDEYTEMTTTTTPVYGPPPAYTTVTEEEEYPPFPTTQPAYGPPVAYTTVTEEEEYPQPAYGPPSAFYDKGDINMDNIINIADYNKMLSAVQGEELYSAEELADIDNDGSVDEDDVDAMRKYLTGQTDSLG
ncbi:MAG: dockerin type I repeat-containing protein [Oscillospiraceae bacterium]|nr:dockerin type I repeat-containing protein [Oscillospiraceae bacterium]